MKFAFYWFSHTLVTVFMYATKLFYRWST